MQTSMYSAYQRAYQWCAHNSAQTLEPLPTQPVLEVRQCPSSLPLPGAGHRPTSEVKFRLPRWRLIANPQCGGGWELPLQDDDRKANAKQASIALMSAEMRLKVRRDFRQGLIPVSRRTSISYWSSPYSRYSGCFSRIYRCSTYGGSEATTEMGTGGKGK